MSASRRDLEQQAALLWQTRQGDGLLRPAEFAERTRKAEVAPPVAFTPVHRTAERLDFSLMFFSAAAGEAARPDLYRLVHEAARFADARGFSAVWLPERHFHAFGGPYPNPAVLAASLARATNSIRLRAGSVVLPLHHPVEVAETWSMVDNLSGGRVEVAFGSGWSPNDFVLSPGTFATARDVLRQRSDEVRRLWRGDSLDLVNGRGETVPTRILPVPLQPELPVWISATGNPDSFAWAGANGFNVLTMLLGGEIDDIAPKIAIYRAARRDAGLDPDGGKVALMLHSFVHPDGDFARATIREPFLDYVRNSVDVQRHGSDEGRAMTETQRAQLIDYAFLRYTRSAALFGTPAECRDMLERAAAAGVDEIACLIDFGVEEGLVLEALEHLDAMRPRRPSAPHSQAASENAAPAQEPIAIVGMSGRFAAAPDLRAFWASISEGKDLLSAPPPGRDGPGMPPRGGFLDDIEGFDARLFGITPAEAATMDPHQRVFLEQVWAAVEDAGYRPSDLRGSATGVFAAVYSTGYEGSLRAKGEALDGLSVVGAVLSMVPNRTSFLFDWTGPSEAVNTACSSGLVAVHRAVAALRMGECGMAVAGGVSLLLVPEETAALGRLGVLSPEGVCRAFDGRANGQVRGEGAGVLVLKR
jgi:natural product biosynthesis luciferase-like monooxygenase protein